MRLFPPPQPRAAGLLPAPRGRGGRQSSQAQHPPCRRGERPATPHLPRGTAPLPGGGDRRGARVSPGNPPPRRGCYPLQEQKGTNSEQKLPDRVAGTIPPQAQRPLRSGEKRGDVAGRVLQIPSRLQVPNLRLSGWDFQSSRGTRSHNSCLIAKVSRSSVSPH